MLSRIHRRFVLGPLTQDDTADYLRTRLRLAGCDRELFTLDTVALLHETAVRCERVLPPDDPLTQTVRQSLANIGDG